MCVGSRESCAIVYTELGHPEDVVSYDLLNGWRTNCRLGTPSHVLNSAVCIS